MIAPQELINNAKNYAATIRTFIEEEIFVEGVHYGKIPNVDKFTLFQPGAQLICVIFGLTPLIEYSKEESHADYDTLTFDFVYTCKITSQEDGVVLSEGTRGSCSSLEAKYGYRWVSEDQVPKNADKNNLVTRNGSITEFDFAIKQAKTEGQYGKPAEYWQRFVEEIEAGTAEQITRPTKKGESIAWKIGGLQYRIKNHEIGDLLNTMRKMAQKRSFVSAVATATGCNDIFTVDMEDLPFKNEGKEISYPNWNQLEAWSATVANQSSIQTLLKGLDLQPLDSNYWAGKTTDDARTLIAKQLVVKERVLYPMSVQYKTYPQIPDKIFYLLNCGFVDVLSTDQSLFDAFQLGEGEIAEISLQRLEITAVPTPDGRFYKTEKVSLSDLSE